MTYRIFPHNGTLTVNEARAMRGGMGLGGLGETAQATVTELEKSSGRMVTGIWVKKPNALPAGYVKHDAISKTRLGWMFGILGTGGMYSITAPTPLPGGRPAGAVPEPYLVGPGMTRVAAPLPEPTDILQQEQVAADYMNQMIMADQPAQTPVPIATEAVSAMTLSQYKDALRRFRDTLKLITAALMVGNDAPPIPPRPIRPPGLDVSGSAAVRDLEAKIDEYLIIRLPFAQKNSGGAGQDPFARPPGGDYPPPNSPSAFPGDQLSPGAGQPELAFVDIVAQIIAESNTMMWAQSIGADGSTPQSKWIDEQIKLRTGTQGIVGSDAVLSAPQATSQAGSGRIDTESPGMPGWGWVAIAGVAAVGAYLFLTKKKGR